MEEADGFHRMWKGLLFTRSSGNPGPSGWQGRVLDEENDKKREYEVTGKVALREEDRSHRIDEIRVDW